MYKQCFEIISAQGKYKLQFILVGTNPNKAFSLLSKKNGSSQAGVSSKHTTRSGVTSSHSTIAGDQLRKQFDGGVKANIFHFNGHRIQWPPVAPSSSTTTRTGTAKSNLLEK